MGDDIKVNQVGLKPPEPKKSTTTTKKLRFESEEEAQKYMKERQAVAKDSKGQTTVQLRQVAAKTTQKQTAQELQQARASKADKAHEVAFKKAGPTQTVTAQRMSSGDVTLPAAGMREIDNKVLQGFLDKAGGLRTLMDKMNTPEFRQSAVTVMGNVYSVSGGKVDKWSLIKLLLEMAYQNQDINKIAQSASQRVAIASANLNVVAAKIDLYQQQMQARYNLLKHGVDQLNSMFGMGGLVDKAKEFVCSLITMHAEIVLSQAETAFAQNRETITRLAGPPLGNADAQAARTELQNALAADPADPGRVAAAEERFWAAAPPDARAAREAYQQALNARPVNHAAVRTAAERLDAAVGEVVRHQVTLSSSSASVEEKGRARTGLAAANRSLATERSPERQRQLQAGMREAMESYRSGMGLVFLLSHPDMSPEEAQRVVDARVQRRANEAMNESLGAIQPIIARERSLNTRDGELSAELERTNPAATPQRRTEIETERRAIRTELRQLGDQRTHLASTAAMQLAPLRDHESRIMEMATVRSQLRDRGHDVPSFAIPPAGADAALAEYNTACNQVPPNAARIEEAQRAYEAIMRPAERAYEAARTSASDIEDPMRQAIPEPRPSATDRASDPPATDTSPRAAAIRAYRESQDDIASVNVSRARISPPLTAAEESNRSGDAALLPLERRAAVMEFRVAQDMYAVRVARHSGATPATLRPLEERAAASARALVPGTPPSPTDRSADAAEANPTRRAALRVYRATQDALAGDMPLSTPHMAAWERRADARVTRDVSDQHLRVLEGERVTLTAREFELGRLSRVEAEITRITGSAEGTVATPPTGGRLGALHTEKTGLEAERARLVGPPAVAGSEARLAEITTRLTAIGTESTTLTANAARLGIERTALLVTEPAAIEERSSIQRRLGAIDQEEAVVRIDQAEAQHAMDDADRMLEILDAAAPHQPTGAEVASITSAFIGAEPQRVEDVRRERDLAVHRANVATTEAELTAIMGMADGVVPPAPGGPGGELGALTAERARITGAPESTARSTRLAAIDRRMSQIRERMATLTAERTRLVGLTDAKVEAVRVARAGTVESRTTFDLAMREVEIRSEYRQGDPPAIPAADQAAVDALIRDHRAAAMRNSAAAVSYSANGGTLDPTTRMPPGADAAFDPYSWETTSAYEAIPTPPDRPSFDPAPADPGDTTPRGVAIMRFRQVQDREERTRELALAYDALPDPKPDMRDRSGDAAAAPDRRDAILRFRELQDGIASVRSAEAAIQPPLTAAERSNPAGDAAITPVERRNAIVAYRSAQDAYAVRHARASIPPPVPAPVPPATGDVSPTDRSGDASATPPARREAIVAYRAAQDAMVQNALNGVSAPAPPVTAVASGEGADPTDDSPRAIAIARYREAQRGAVATTTPDAVETTPRTREALYQRLFVATPPGHPAFAAITPPPTAAEIATPPTGPRGDAIREATRTMNRDRARWDAGAASTDMIAGEGAAMRGWRPADATRYTELLRERERLSTLVPPPSPLPADAYPVASDRSPRADAIRSLRESELALARHTIDANRRTHSDVPDIPSELSTALAERTPKMLALAEARAALAALPASATPDERTAAQARVTRAEQALASVNQLLTSNGATGYTPRTARHAADQRGPLLARMEAARQAIPPPGYAVGDEKPPKDDHSQYANAVRAYLRAKNAYDDNETSVRRGDRAGTAHGAREARDIERHGWNWFAHGFGSVVEGVGRMVNLFGRGRGGWETGLLEIGWDAVRAHMRAANAISGIRAELFGQLDQAIAEAHGELGRAEAQNIADWEKKMALCKKLVEGKVRAG